MSDENIVSEPRPIDPDRNFRPDRLIHEITLRNILSFGPDTPPLKLGNLNVLIGPNGSGKSNLIEAIGLLKAAPKDLSEPVKDGGGVNDWLWKGAQRPTASIEVVLHFPNGKPHKSSRMSLRHRIAFTEHARRFEVVDESIENTEAFLNASKDDVYFYYRYQGGHPVLNTVVEGARKLKRETIKPDQSVLPQYVDPERYPELGYLNSVYERIGIYRDWTFGRYTPPRLTQKTDLAAAHLSSTAENLAHVLNYYRSKIKTPLIEALRDIYDDADDFNVQFVAGLTQLFMEEGDFSIPATRLSDGTLRYLCLLVILLDPDPPPLICIDEPELGLHPDIIPTLARLMRSASQRTQLIVTTHSTTLVDAMTETPECVIVCGKEAGASTMYRLPADEMQRWMKNYSLGKLWRIGELAGNRW
ncbi:MAG TPA: AAA family ATPase [Flavobacteriales bacterium]|nr:AAA family ATPase [Flavobacteriales bacterium]HMR28852.1 AAA family ATPase [Flavobacteriales bacterium]